jgi:lipopolysaccharide/colanic/teichoic acid biosynthesis glycosyltransferase
VKGPYSRFFKRWLDFLLALVGIILLSPLLAVLAMLVWWRLGRPVMFAQERPGLYGRPFRIVKFRTMTDGRDADGNILPDEVRLPGFGRFLRATSLDELPELWNVLLGDMSFVGPRPLLMEYIPHYTTVQMRRHEVRPGITGWAQVNGRNALSWEAKFDYDVWYVDHVSLMLDLEILWATVGEVVRAKGISQPGQATAEKFRGGKRPNPEAGVEK